MSSSGGHAFEQTALKRELQTRIGAAPSASTDRRNAGGPITRLSALSPFPVDVQQQTNVAGLWLSLLSPELKTLHVTASFLHHVRSASPALFRFGRDPNNLQAGDEESMR